MKKILVVTVFVISSLMADDMLRAQGQFTTMGRDFWLTFGDNDRQSIDDISFQLRFVAPETSIITLSFISNPSLDQVITVQAGQVFTYNMSNNQKAALYNNTSGTSSKSLHVTSDHNISLFAINSYAYSTDATNVLPTSNLGTDYYHLSAEGKLLPKGDGFCIVAVENNTGIWIDGTLAATINRGAVYSAYYGQTDQTGRHVTSDKPVAFFNVNSCASLPTNNSTCDCFFQQLVPVSSWGTRFIAPVTNQDNNGKNSTVRIVASQNNTRIEHTGGMANQATPYPSPILLNAGQFVEFQIYQDQQYGGAGGNGCYIESDKPVAVGAYLTSQTKYNSNSGDPSLTWLPPFEQSVAHTVIAPFIPAGASNLENHYALIMVPTAHKNATTIAAGVGAEQPLTGVSWTDNVASGYSYCSIELPLNSDNNNIKLTYSFANPYGLLILGYGLGIGVSYYYMAAASARQLDAAFYIDDTRDHNFTGEKHFQDANGQTYCDSEFKFTAAIHYALASGDNLQWYIDGSERQDLRNNLSWTMPAGGFLGTHTVKLKITDSYGQSREIETTFTVLSNPNPVLSQNLSAQTICEGTAPTIRVTNTQQSLTYRVWTAATGGTMTGSAQGNGGTLDIPCTGNLSAGATYYVETFNGSCASFPRIPVSITVQPRPVITSQQSAFDVCKDLKPLIKLYPTTVGVVYNVYTENAGGTLVGSGNGTGQFADLIITLNTPVSTATSFYVEAVSGGCTSFSRKKVDVSVKSRPALNQGNISVTDVLCNGGNSGSITVTGVTGGTGNYYYYFNNIYNSINNVKNQLAAGTYKITVADNSCSSDELSVTVSQPAALTASADAENLTCNAADDGKITVSAAGGVSPYRYSADGGANSQTGNTFGSLPAGTYEIVVIDNNGCQTASLEKTVSQPDEILIPNPQITNVTCNGGSDGSITVTGITGGTSPYEYVFNGYAYTSDNTAGQLSAGVYTVRIRDANSCLSVIKYVSIAEPPVALAAGDVSFPVACLGAVAKMTVSNSSPDIEYRVYDSRTDAAPRGSAFGNGGLLDISVGIMNETDSMFIETYTATTGCTSISRVKVITEFIKTLSSYPDIRAYACMYSAAGSVSLSKYIDTSYLQSITWASLSHSASIDPLTGTIDSDLQPGTNTHTFTYTVSNNCISSQTRKFYLHAVRSSSFNVPVPDTVTVCYRHAEALQINQIFGMDFNGTFSYSPVPGIDNCIKYSTQYGGLIFNGKKACEDGILPALSYNGQQARFIDFEYASDAASCLQGKTYRITIALTGL